MATFPLLADPDHYTACPWDLTRDAHARAQWLDVFTDHWPSLIAEAVAEGLDRGASEADLRAQGEVAQRLLDTFLERVRHKPESFGRLTLLQICVEREKALRAAGIADPYRLAKQRENDRALAVLPDLLSQLDAASATDRAVQMIEGVFAGNIFDLGAVATSEMFVGGATVDFHDIRSKLKAHPWRIDHLDAWITRLNHGPAYRSAVICVDNAGPDICLGMIPFARDLLERGTEVLLAANETPTLNDITAGELTDLLGRVAQVDPPIATAMDHGRLSVVSSGNGSPLIDLSQISVAFAKDIASRQPDLLVLEGMGRALETNFDAAFTCDTLKLAMVKESAVAEKLGGELYDLVMRFEPRSC